MTNPSNCEDNNCELSNIDHTILVQMIDVTLKIGIDELKFNEIKIK